MELVERIKQSDKQALRQLYEENRQPFFRFAFKYSINKEDLEDVYQDAIIAFIENAKKGKIDNLKSSISTYLFAIGKLMIFQKLKKGNRLEATSDFENLGLVWEEFEEDENTEQKEKLRLALAKLGDQCRKMLSLFYYENKKLDDITTAMNYESKDVTKSQKSRCIKQLKELMRK